MNLFKRIPVVSYSILLLTCLFSIKASAQNASLQWVKQNGGNFATVTSTAICTDNSGNIYTTGIFSGTVDFDPGTGVYSLTSSGIDNIFITKTDPSGNLIWAGKIGGSKDDRSTSITADVAGNIYLTGYLSDTADFDIGAGTYLLSATGAYDMFILKMNAAGNFMWAKKTGGTSHSTDYLLTNAIKASADGYIYVAGSLTGKVSFGPNASTDSLTSGYAVNNGWYGNIFVAKYDNQGNFIWVKKTGALDNESAYALTLDSAGNVYTTGIFSGAVDFDPGPGSNILTSSSNPNMFVQKMDASGNYIWATRIASTNTSSGLSITADKWGNIICAGSFSSTLYFPNGQYFFSPGTSIDEGFVCKLDSAGNYVWAVPQPYSSASFRSYSNSITTDTAGNIYFCGYIAASNITSSYINKMDSAGTTIFNKRLLPVSGAKVTAAALALDASGSIYTTGNFVSLVDFDPNVAATYNLTATATDQFLHKMAPCTAYKDTFEAGVCAAYTFDGTTYTTSGYYTKYYAMANGCDSVVTVHLTVTPTDGSIVPPSSNILTANMANASYQWVQCNIPFGLTPIPGATSQSYTVTTNGAYAVIVSHFDCKDTSGCFLFNTLGITTPGNNENITVYPNPAKDYFVADGLPIGANLELSNTLGQVVYTAVADKTTMSLQLPGLSKGVYILKVGSNNHVSYKQIVID